MINNNKTRNNNKQKSATATTNHTQHYKIWEELGVKIENRPTE